MLDEIIIEIKVENGITEVKGPSKGCIGTKYAEGLGYYLEWNWNGKTLNVHSHPEGFYPAYYHATENFFILSRDLLPMLSRIEEPQLDHQTIAVFLGTGLILGQSTPFSNIQAMPEGGSIKWTAGNLPSVSSRTPIKTLDNAKRKELIKRFIDLFRQAIARSKPQSIRLPLSGGRDSRHILLELLRQGCPIEKAVTSESFPPGNNADVFVARQIADFLDINHQILKQERPWIVCERRKNLVNSFNFKEGAWKVVLSDICDNQRHDIFDGIGGDALASGLFINPELTEATKNRDISTVTERLIRQRDTYIFKLLRMNSEYYNINYVKEVMQNRLSQYLDEDDFVASFYLWNRTRRQIASQTTGIFRAGRIHAPFLDPDIFQFLRSIPREILKDKDFHSDTLKKAFPRAHQIPYAAGGPAPLSVGQRLHLAGCLGKGILFRRSCPLSRTRTAKRIASLIGGNAPWRFYNVFAPEIVYILQIEDLSCGAMSAKIS